MIHKKHIVHDVHNVFIGTYFRLIGYVYNDCALSGAYQPLSGWSVSQLFNGEFAICVGSAKQSVMAGLMGLTIDHYLEYIR